ncbi:MAG: nucleotide exchange factor GrpE [Candidatus Falkowbacteria bacterium]
MDKEKKKINKIKIDDFENKYKRALADYQNLLKRTATEKQEFAKYANEQLIYEILPVYDNLRLALKHSEKAGENNITDGIRYVIKQFKDVLENAGVQKIRTAGEKFNPEFMEAIEGKGEKVKKEVRAGYKLHDKIIIPAKVILE